MILCVFFGSAADPAPIAAAFDELTGTADVDGRRAGVRARTEGELEAAADGALGVIWSGREGGAGQVAQDEACRRGFLPVAHPEPVPWMIDRREQDPAIYLCARGFLAGPPTGDELALLDALWGAGIDVELVMS